MAQQRPHSLIRLALAALSSAGAMLTAACSMPASSERGPSDSSAAFEKRLAPLLPAVQAWYNAAESELAPRGRPLSDAEMAHARALGVARPQEIRVVVLESFPLPDDPQLLAEAKRLGVGVRFEAGRTMGRVIMLKPGWSGDRRVLAHEMVHVSQQDRLGRTRFLHQILVELGTVGYEHSPLEQEAYEKQNLPW